MIKSFKCKDTKLLFNQKRVARFQAIAQIARTKLIVLDSVVMLEELANIPGLRLEALSGNRKGQRSIRINQQWRICFEWHNDGVYNVEIVDYH